MVQIVIIIVYNNYLHAYQKRSQIQISQTTNRIKQISSINLCRLNKLEEEKLQLCEQKLKSIIMICISGVPPFPQEFTFLTKGFKSYHIKAQNFTLDQPQQNHIKNLALCNFSEQSLKIHKIIQSQANKQIIFVYHSFGTYMLSAYFHQYGHDRIKGLIEIGAAPITMYKYIAQIISLANKYTQQDIISNMQRVVSKDLNSLMDKLNNELEIRWDYFSTTVGASFLTFIKSKQMPIMFDLNRRYPNILKLMIFGEEDKIFQTDLICQRADFYSKQKIKNQNIVKDKFQKHAISTFDNVQKQFIFEIPQGKHSVHLQKKHQKLIRKAIKQYLIVIL